MRRSGFLAVATAIVTLAGCSSVEVGGGSSPVTGSAGATGNAVGAAPQLVQCQQQVGTIALVESQVPALAQIGLTSPVPLLRLMAAQSRCFYVVERGQALTRMMQERQLSQGGMLQQGSNVGQGQMVAADYMITPNVAFSQRNAGGAGLRGLGFVPYVGPALAVGGSVAGSVRFSEAQAVLMVTDTRSGVQTAVAEGRAKATDLGGGLGLGGIYGFGNLAGYSNTDEGKVVAGAFLEAFNKLVAQVQAQPRK
jgi:Curli production assembly/transport component CsgG